MRIVHVSDYFHPTLGYQDAFLSLAQIDQGHDVSVVTSDRYRPFDDYEQSVGAVLGPRSVGPGRRQERGIDVIRLPTPVELHYRCWLRGLPRAITSLAPDLVIVHGVSTGQASRVARIRERLVRRGERPFHLVVDDHMVPGGRESAPRRAFYAGFRRFEVPRLKRQADALVAVTASTRTFMVDSYGLTPEEVEIVPLGAYVPIFSFREEGRNRLRQRFGYGDDDIVYLYAGKVVHQKRPDLLVDAALRAIPQDRRIRVLLAGGGAPDYVGPLQARIAAHGLSRHFTWMATMPNDELPDLYSASDVGVWPARSSLAMIEAQSCGLPIIVSSFPAAAERVTEGNGLVFPEDDIEGLADAMVRLTSGATRRDMGQRGRHIVERDLDYRHLSDAFLTLAGAS